MGTVRFNPQQIIGKLPEAKLLLGQGTNISLGYWPPALEAFEPRTFTSQMVL